MTETVVYEYAVKSSGASTYTVSPGSEAAVATTVENLSLGDQFVVDGQVFSYMGGGDAGAGGPEVGFFAVGRNGVMHFFSLSPITSTETVTINTDQSFSICFMAGTSIATPTGPVAIEKLAIGDLVSTHSGRAVPVRWIGVQTISRPHANPTRVLPVRISAGALGEKLPRRDLLVSPGHALLIEGVLVQAGALVNHTTITREIGVTDSFCYYHVETDDHSLILAEGVPAETFIDHVDRIAFDNWYEHQLLYPEGRTVAEMNVPRVTSVRQLPSAIADIIAERAVLLQGVFRSAA
jgi:hypothetical protein